jgi:hypothetical protein
MNDVEKRAIMLVKELAPNCEKIEFDAIIGDTSHSIEFFVWIDNEKRQNYELVDDGIINERKMSKLFEEFARAVRKESCFKTGEVTQVTVSCKNDTK